MIDKQQAELLGVNVIDTNNQGNDDKVAIINKIKDLLPNIINSDNQLDTKALNDLLGVANSTSNNQGYELTFAGKGLARAKADAPTNKELKIELEQSKNFDKTQNIVIRGDNIDALKVLYKNYHKQIKMIYIDPPYNTKSENFVYNDNFKVSEAELCEEFGLNEETTNFLTSVYGTRSHSGWLSFMYPRLKLARELLTDDGVIFISIDDNEQANLKIICDEIFGVDNFITQFIWKKKGGSSNTEKIVGNLVEYIVCYAKNKTSGIFNYKKIERQYRYKDEIGFYNLEGIEKTNLGSYERPTMIFPIIDPLTNSSYLPQDNMRWTIGKELVDKLIKEDKLFFDRVNNKVKIIKRPEDYESSENLFYNLLLNSGSMSMAKDEINNILHNREIFDTPKPVILMRDLLIIVTKKDDIVLDFFAGSGTTGDAVMQLNAEDGGKRKFILVQWDERIAENKEAYKFCTENNLEPFISSITIERLNRAGEKIKAEQQAKNPDLLANDTTNELDIGYKVFSLVDKPKIDYQNDSLAIINSRVGALNTLYNMLVATCKPLDIKIEEIILDVLYKAANEIYVVGNIDVDTLSKYRDLKVNIDAFVDISLESYLNLGLLDKDNVYMIYS